MKSHLIRHAVAFAVTAITVSSLGAPVATAAYERRVNCSESLVRGTYSGQFQGTQTLADGSVQNLIGVVVRFYDGRGGVTQVDTIKNSVTGVFPNRYGTGIYTVNDDCTFDVEFHPAPNVHILERGVIMDDGWELRSITLVPTGLFVTSTSKRVQTEK